MNLRFPCLLTTILVSLATFVNQAHGANLPCEQLSGVYEGKCKLGDIVFKNEFLRFKIRVGYTRSQDPNDPVLKRSTCQQVTIESWTQGNGSRVLLPNSSFFDIHQSTTTKTEFTNPVTGAVQVERLVTITSAWNKDLAEFMTTRNQKIYSYVSSSGIDREDVSTFTVAYHLEGAKLIAVKTSDNPSTEAICTYRKIGEAETLLEESDARK